MSTTTTTSTPTTSIPVASATILLPSTSTTSTTAPTSATLKSTIAKPKTTTTTSIPVTSAPTTNDPSTIVPVATTTSTKHPAIMTPSTSLTADHTATACAPPTCATTKGSAPIIPSQPHNVTPLVVDPVINADPSVAKQFYFNLQTPNIPTDYIPTRNSVTYFMHNDEPVMALVNPPSGQISAVLPLESGKLTKKAVTPELKYRIAKCLKYESVVGVGSNDPAVEFQVCAVSRDDFESEPKLALDNDQYYDGDERKPELIRLSCYCMEPAVKGYKETNPDFKTTYTCQKCKDVYHDTCLQEKEKKPVGKSFKCTPCSTQTTGAFWSAGDTTNTCTLDNVTTGATLHTEQHGKRWLSEMKGTPQEEHFRTVVEHTIEGEFDQGQNHWYNEVVVPKHFEELNVAENRNHQIVDLNKYRASKGLDPQALQQLPTLTQGSLYGSVYEQTYRHVSAGSSFVEIKNCDQKGCPPREDVRTSFTNSSMKKIGEQTTSPCRTCKKGTVTSSIVNPNGKQPWMVHVDVENLDETATEELIDKTKTPDVLRIDGKEYEKQTITLFNPEMNSGHYVSLQKYNGDWIWYDGLQTEHMPYEHKRFRKITPDGIINYGVTVSKILIHYMLWY